MENKELILKTIKDATKPLKGGEISELSGLDKKTVDKLLKELKTEEVIYSPKRCFYDLS